MNKGRFTTLCQEETASIQHLLLPQQRRTEFPGLEERGIEFAQLLMDRAAMFARSRAYAAAGKIVGKKQNIDICDADLHNAWDVLFQEEHQ